MKLALLTCSWLAWTAPQEPPVPPAPTSTTAAAALAYDPMALPDAELPESLPLVVVDATRDREIPVRVYLPTNTSKAPIVLWSHGLGGSRDNSAYLGRHWSARGFVVVMMQHAGSDESVWKDAKPRERYATLQKAASGENLLLRCADVKAVLDQLTSWHGTAGHPLHDRLDLEHVGMCGHSFGAVTTQAVSGQSMPVLGAKFTDPRIDAALPMSPSKPRAGDVGKAFGSVRIPWLLMTGTEDRSPIGDIDVEDRLVVYPALPSSVDRYELVLDGAQHSVFGERAIGADRAIKEQHHRTILALSTAFWDAHLRSDPAAKQWLCGDGARRALSDGDRWQLAAAGSATPTPTGEAKPAEPAEPAPTEPGRRRRR
ncbi:MAG: dienelactone hydrolase [Planctomycetes bacterium]|nr:dienelactone hydrolase [Planctomycetota bacterium]